MLTSSHNQASVTRTTWQRVRGRYWLTCISKSSCCCCSPAASSSMAATLGCPSTLVFSSAVILAWHSGTCKWSEGLPHAHAVDICIAQQCMCIVLVDLPASCMFDSVQIWLTCFLQFNPRMSDCGIVQQPAALAYTGEQSSQTF